MKAFVPSFLHWQKKVVMHSIRVLSFCCTVLVLVYYSPAPTFADCEMSHISLSEDSGTPGAMLRVSGGFWAHCEVERLPAKGVKIIFVQGGRARELLVVDADNTAKIDVVVVIPADAQAGKAEIYFEVPAGYIGEGRRRRYVQTARSRIESLTIAAR
jgi:catechol 2,3-dioxygenase-like lactoylglutathione lyase family enzyme